MIIQCEKCETTYRFNSARLQNGEAQVRCIRCGNIFTVDSLSDLGEGFLNTETAGGKQYSPDQAVSSTPVTADDFTDTSEEQTSPSPFDTPTDIPVPQPDFTMDSQADQEHEEEDFWTSPSEFSLDTSETATDSSKKHPTSEEESDQPSENDPNEFIFEPLEEEENIAGIPEKPQEHPVNEPENAPSPGSTSKKVPKLRKKALNCSLLCLLLSLSGPGSTRTISLPTESPAYLNSY